MTKAMPVKVTDGGGLKKLRLQFLYAGTVINKSLGPKIARQVAEKILAESQKLVPVDTGALKASGRIAMMPNRKDVSVRYGRSTVRYAAVVEFGRTAYAPYPPRPYLRPAIQAAKGQFGKTAKAAIDPVLMSMFDRKWGYG